MLSMGLGIECQANLNASVLRQKLPQQKHKLLLVNNNQRALNFKPRTSTFSVSHSLPELKLRLTQTTRNVKLSAAAESLVAEETAAADDNLTTETPLEKEVCFIPRTLFLVFFFLPINWLCHWKFDIYVFLRSVWLLGKCRDSLESWKLIQTVAMLRLADANS